MSATNASASRPAESDDQVLELREQIRRKKLGLTVMRAIPGGLVLLLAVFVVLAIVTGVRGFSSGAVLVGSMLLMSGLLIGPEYYTEKDALLALTSKLRRRMAHLARTSSREQGVGAQRFAYRAMIPDQIEAYRLGARKLRRTHNFLQSVVIVGSISASALVAFSVESGLMRVAAVVNTLLVGLAATVSTYFKFKERSLNHQAFADTLETELRAAELRIGDYVGKSDDAVLEQLIARVESARAEHNLLERQLDQASEVTLPTLPEGGSER